MLGLAAGCTKKLKPTPLGTTFLDWHGTATPSTTSVRRLALRSSTGSRYDFDLTLGMTEERLGSAVAVARSNPDGSTFRGWVTEDTTGIKDFDLPVGRVFVSATTTGPWTSRGNQYGSSAMLEFRTKGRLTNAMKAPIPRCDAGEAPPKGDICER